MIILNYYIDFDNTLFDTPKLTQRMLEAIVNTSKLDIMDECKKMFNREHIYNIYELAKYFSDKYDLNKFELIQAINNEINHCSDLIFIDSLSFLQNLKDHGHKIFMLSYYEYGLQYQIAKIAGSHIADLFDEIIITKDLKYTLDIDYSKGIFIDDKPQDLIGLYSKNPKKVIRLRRIGSKYSPKDVEINIEEYRNFDEIPID